MKPQRGRFKRLHREINPKSHKVADCQARRSA
jgi:hypothetical protein